MAFAQDDAVMAWFTANWESIREFFNSVFFTSIAGSLAGALAGALAAQRIAERGKYRDQLLKEIRDTNAAISITFGICTSLLSIKKQHVKPLKENYYKQRADLLEHQAKLKAGELPAGTPFEVHADLQTLSLPPLRVDALQKLIFDGLSVRARPLNLMINFGQSIHAFDSFLELRRNLIEQFKAKGGADPVLYFGLPRGGQVRAEYLTAIDGISSQLDESIFFGSLLCKDLVEHGQFLEARFKKNFKKGAPRINQPDFAKAQETGLMPDQANYADWLTMFKKYDPVPPTGFRHRLRDRTEPVRHLFK